MNIRLREYREALGMTQPELAREIGKSFRTIQSWERGESFPNAANVWDLCKCFHVDPNTLLGWYEEHPRELPSPPAYADPRQARMNAAYEKMGEDSKDGASASVTAMWEAERARAKATVQDDVNNREAM
jgi:transcriptional regulator with XRE-family HTH domain